MNGSVPVWFLAAAVVGALCVGMIIGTRTVGALRLRMWEALDDLIHTIETVMDLTPDHRINPHVALQPLYALRGSLRISERDEALRRRSTD